MRTSTVLTLFSLSALSLSKPQYVDQQAANPAYIASFPSDDCTGVPGDGGKTFIFDDTKRGIGFKPTEGSKSIGVNLNGEIARVRFFEAADDKDTGCSKKIGTFTSITYATDPDYAKDQTHLSICLKADSDLYKRICGVQKGQSSDQPAEVELIGNVMYDGIVDLRHRSVDGRGGYRDQNVLIAKLDFV
ncbi:uncharacterized protein KY384_003470 [Bacidia gigantensis]|uniref:uncharacterized protein n=1 Tax=Bacidia gigantensis TaxID=2732470 RepID=UPI001D0393EE|nr:uncharacterized protein KY384_003470 [Bacidia gigantensis]KAG8531834.1 hypothetical protein KY384_003470 [Bacidia gigantensis]